MVRDLMGPIILNDLAEYNAQLIPAKFAGTNRPVRINWEAGLKKGALRG